MTSLVNQTQIVFAIQEKNKMPFDHEPLSASTQRSSLLAASGDDHIQSSLHHPTLQPCIYIAFRCSRCGAVRQAISQVPAQAVVACPECSQECAFVLLGSGLTTSPLPFHQVHIVEPTRCDPALDGEADSS